MKAVILAGGFGARILEYTKKIPKPMIQIAGKPILEHIINIFSSQSYTDFIIATGYKKNLIEKYFKNFYIHKNKYILKNSFSPVNIQFIDTGLNTMTGGRLKRLINYLKDEENFMFTYGDGVANVNLKKLDNFHSKNKNLATVTAVRPLSRYGILKIKGRVVTSFKEKQTINNSWVNGGFFIFNKDIFKYIKNDETILEKEPLETLAKKKKLSVLKHKGFWHSIDTKRDKEQIEGIIKKSNTLPWMKNIK
jgi:glucose-1-phosphate cytidylyltransferase